MRVEANVSLRQRGTRAVRDPGRGQEHELVPLGRAGDRIRDRPPGGSARRGRVARPGDARLVTRTAARRTGCGRRRRPTTTATSRSRTCRRSTSIRPGWTSCAPVCRSCRRLAGRDTRRRSGSRPYDAAVLVAIRTRTALFEATLAPIRRSTRSRSRTGSPATTCGCATRHAVDTTVRVAAAELAALSGSSATDRSRARTPRRSSSCTSIAARRRRPSSTARGFHQISDTDAARRGRRRGYRREPGRCRRLSGRQGPGGRLPRRPGDEGDTRPGQRRRSSRPPSASASTGRRRGATWDASTCCCGAPASR